MPGKFSDRDNIFQFCAQERLAAYTARHSGRNRMAEITRMKRTLKVDWGYWGYCQLGIFNMVIPIGDIANWGFLLERR